MCASRQGQWAIHSPALAGSLTSTTPHPPVLPHTQAYTHLYMNSSGGWVLSLASGLPFACMSKGLEGKGGSTLWSIKTSS